MLTDFGALPPRDRNLVRLMILDDAPDLIALVGELSIRDADFRTWWTSHPVPGLGPVARTFHHPVVGDLTLDVHQLSVGTHPDLLLAAYTAPPDSHSREALRVLLLPSASAPPTSPR